MTYDYQCDACGHAFEAAQRISEPALSTCPECHAAALQRLIAGGVGVIMGGAASAPASMPAMGPCGPCGCSMADDGKCELD